MVKTIEEPTGGEELGYLIVPDDTKQIWYANIICSDCYANKKTED